MNIRQLAYFTQDISIDDSDMTGFFEVKLDLFPLVANVVCKEIVVNKKILMRQTFFGEKKINKTCFDLLQSFLKKANWHRGCIFLRLLDNPKNIRQINTMDLKDNMNVVLSERKKLNMNDDYGIEKCWNKIT